MAKESMGNLLWSNPLSSPPSDDAHTEAESLSDRVLKEKIELLESKIASGITEKLPDKGLKLHVRLDALRQQLHLKRRREEHAKGEKSDVSLCEEAESVDHFLKSSSCNQSLKTSTACFHQTFESEVDDGVHCREINSRSDTIGSLMLNESQINEANMPSGTLPKSCPPSAIKKDGRNSYSSSEDRRMLTRSAKRLSDTIGSLTLNETQINEADMASRRSPKSCLTPTIKKDGRNSCSSSADRRMLTRSAKRRKTLENHLAPPGEWTEVCAVVLLDEEDELPVKPKNERHNLDKRKDAKIHFPSRDHPQCVEICYSDIKCLDPQSYLSSTIMNFYIQYLQKTISPSCRLGTECHFFNTYFYNKLEEAVCSKIDRSATFSKLRRWLKGVNIFQKAYIFLPVHGDLHWSLVIICIPTLEDEAGPIVLHLDSLGFHDGNRIFKSIESYLREEWEHICRNVSSPDVPISEKVWAELPRRIKRRKITVPQQKNDYDCGLFVLYFIQRFIEEAPERLKKKKQPAMFGSKWFQPEEASGLRRKIRTLLLKEFEKARQEITDPAVSREQLSNMMHC